jgi:hypothetical protein
VKLLHVVDLHRQRSQALDEVNPSINKDDEDWWWPAKVKTLT